jgi:fibronectin-binding autotransporter adhesin
VVFEYRWRLKPTAVDSGSLSVAVPLIGVHSAIASVCVFLCICLNTAPAVAIDGTWTGTTNSDWNTDTNWSPGPAPTNTASFTNNGAPTSVAIGGLTSINTIQFAAGAPTYSFTFPVGGFQAFTINGAGIINNSSNAPIFGFGEIFFKNGSTAGNAVFSVVEFDDHSNAGTATISNSLGSGSTAEFTGSSSAANATITTNNGIETSFGDSSTGR